MPTNRITPRVKPLTRSERQALAMICECVYDGTGGLLIAFGPQDAHHVEFVLQPEIRPCDPRGDIFRHAARELRRVAVYCNHAAAQLERGGAQ
jgi:hypothetical protein